MHRQLGDTTLAAIVLTGGKSERMGSPKALLRFKGRTFLEHILAAIRDAGIEQTAIVVGHHRDEIAGAFPGLPLVFNPDYEQGMSTSVKAGVRALPAGIDGAGVFLVDHPLIDVSTIKLLSDRLRPGCILLPSHAGRRGHPVFFSADLFGEILSLGPDEGLNTVVRRDPARVITLAVSNPGVLADIDTPEQFEILLRETE
jgi:molybdenum cofactor cytidylyltransferase